MPKSSLKAFSSKSGETIKKDVDQFEKETWNLLNFRNGFKVFCNHSSLTGQSDDDKMTKLASYCEYMSNISKLTFEILLLFIALLTYFGFGLYGTIAIVVFEKIINPFKFAQSPLETQSKVKQFYKLKLEANSLEINPELLAKTLKSAS